MKNSAMASDKLPTSTSAKRKKLIGFSNWAQWASFTKSMLIKKDVWDLVETGLRPLQQNASRLWDCKKNVKGRPLVPNLITYKVGHVRL